MTSGFKRWASLCAVAALLLLSGCASVKSTDARDPWESMNRSIYNFNDAVDTVAIKPVTQIYVNVVPSFVRTGLHNVVSNLGDIWSMANSAMQLKLQHTAESFMRVSVNTVFGLGGLLDIATEMRLERHKEDFGQTLGYWGVKTGPYMVLPLLGPSTLRDSVAFPLDYQGSAVRQFSDSSTRTSLTAVNILDVRANLLKTVDTVKEAALDPYSFVRDAYLQKRNNDVHDGNPPSDFDYSDQDAP
jgi:phospholipid-binding lipoprotein MlaA